MLSIFATTFLIISILGGIDYIRTATTGPTIPPNGVSTTVNNSPSEHRPSSIDMRYRVAKDQPRLIEISAIDTIAYVQRVGIDSTGAMATPSNIYFSGWYVNSSAPGDKGLSIINGHAGGRYNDGIFKNLNKLVANDQVRVQMGDLSWRELKVMSVNTYSLVDAASHLFDKDEAANSQLNLITCDGKFNDRARTYDKRTIVSAAFIK